MAQRQEEVFVLLADLIKKLQEKDLPFQHSAAPFPKILLNDLTLDSRKAGSGILFIALKGTHVNGEDFIPEALQKGSQVIAASPHLWEHIARSHPEAFFIGADAMRLFVSHLSQIFYPEQPETIVAITGTNGKTSTADFTRHLWDFLGKKSASLGTLGVRSADLTLEKHLTTPEAPYLHSVLQDLAQHKITHLAMEASSHGIDQYRLERVVLKAAAFTNLSPEHLDYHHSMESYLHAKSLLFSRVLPLDGTCVLNADIPEFSRLQLACSSRKILSYGRKGHDIQLLNLSPQATHQDVSLKVHGKVWDIHFPLIGAFQLYNALCALGLVMACDSTCVEQAVKGLETIPQVPGRLEYIGSTASEAGIYLDYAHTPDGVETLLRSLRPHTKNLLHIVFGGGGNRDPSTRKPRGVLAETLADHVYICDDNPRWEDPQRIRSEILKGCPKAFEIPDRHEAILKAVHSLKAGDILVVAGKGREEGQEVQGKVLPFDDATTILEAIGEKS